MITAGTDAKDGRAAVRRTAARTQRDGWMIRPSPPGDEVPSGIVTFGARGRCCRNAVLGRSQRHGTTLRRWVISGGISAKRWHAEVQSMSAASSYEHLCNSSPNAPCMTAASRSRNMGVLYLRYPSWQSPLAACVLLVTALTLPGRARHPACREENRSRHAAGLGSTCGWGNTETGRRRSATTAAGWVPARRCPGAGVASLRTGG